MKTLRMLLLQFLGLIIVAATVHVARAGSMLITCGSGNCDYYTSVNGQTQTSSGKCGTYTSNSGSTTCTCSVGSNSQEQAGCQN